MGMHMVEKVLFASFLVAAMSGAMGRELLDTAACNTLIQNLGTGTCNNLLSQQSALANPNVTDAQIQTYASLSTPPTADCCEAIKGVATNSCQCDPTYIALAQTYNVSADQLVLLARYIKIACGPTYVPASVDPYCD